MQEQRTEGGIIYFGEPPKRDEPVTATYTVDEPKGKAKLAVARTPNRAERREAAQAARRITRRLQRRNARLARLAAGRAA